MHAVALVEAVALNVLTGHAAQTVSVLGVQAAAANIPCGHNEQAAQAPCPAAVATVAPATQAAQAVLEPPAADPAAHCTGACVGSRQLAPAGQATHALAPVTLAYDPAEQAAQATTPPGAKVPG